jgi:GNAT superfamily N-acetyltransferase
VSSLFREAQKKPIRIRLASQVDAPAVARVLLASFEEYRSLYTDRAFAATTPDADSIARRMDEGPTWVAHQGGHILGTISAIARDDGLYLRGMAVCPHWRRQRVGWAMLEHAEAFARRTGTGRLYLSTTPFLLPATRLYRKYGFRESDEGPPEVLGTALLTMVKPLETCG